MGRIDKRVCRYIGRGKEGGVFWRLIWREKEIGVRVFFADLSPEGKSTPTQRPTTKRIPPVPLVSVLSSCVSPGSWCYDSSDERVALPAGPGAGVRPALRVEGGGTSAGRYPLWWGLCTARRGLLGGSGGGIAYAFPLCFASPLVLLHPDPRTATNLTSG